MIYKILFLSLTSALIAYVADVVGHFIGKKRVSLFGLRPKITARIFTIFTGIFIMFTTVFIVTWFSKEAKIAIFTYESYINKLKNKLNAIEKNYIQMKEYFKKDIAKYRDQLTKVKEELNLTKEQLNTYKKELSNIKQKLFYQRENDIIVKKGEVIGFITIPADESDSKTYKIFKNGIKKIINQLKKDGVLVNEEDLGIEKAWSAIKPSIFSDNCEKLLILIAMENVVPGVNLGKVNIKLLDNKVVFKAGDILPGCIFKDKKTKLEKLLELINLKLIDIDFLAKKKLVLAKPRVYLPITDIVKFLEKYKDQTGKICFQVQKDTKRTSTLYLKLIFSPIK